MPSYALVLGIKSCTTSKRQSEIVVDAHTHTHVCIQCASTYEPPSSMGSLVRLLFSALAGRCVCVCAKSAVLDRYRISVGDSVLRKAKPLLINCFLGFQRELCRNLESALSGDFSSKVLINNKIKSCTLHKLCYKLRT